MNTIRLGIEAELAPLTDLGANLGNDLAAGLAKALQEKQDALVKQAKALGIAVAEALAASLATTGLIKVATTSKPAVKSPSNNPSLVAPKIDTKKQTTGDTIILENGAVKVELAKGSSSTEMADAMTRALLDTLKGRR
jgi:NAD(P)H-hydrate repair Nnr-like enzyme with NAD(P)H-hydrate dehydratase domain